LTNAERKFVGRFEEMKRGVKIMFELRLLWLIGTTRAYYCPYLNLK